jgi:hypothetical protein
MAFSTTLNRLVVVSLAGTTNTVMTSDSASWIPHGYLAGKELSMHTTIWVEQPKHKNFCSK